MSADQTLKMATDGWSCIKLKMEQIQDEVPLSIMSLSVVMVMMEMDNVPLEMDDISLPLIEISYLSS